MRSTAWHVVLICCGLFLLLNSKPSFAQISTPGSRFYYPQNSSRMGFSQEFNSYIWNYGLSTKQIRYKKWTLFLGERYRSSMLRVGPQNDKWKDDQQLTFNLDYRINPFLSLQSVVSSIVYLDQQSGFNNDIQTHANQVGLLIEPSAKVSGRALFGPKTDSRFNRHDKGTFYTFQVNAVDFEWEEYNNSIDFFLTRDRYKSRQNSDFNVGYQVQRQFVAGTTDSLYLFTNNRRRDYYVSVGGGVESYRERMKGLDNQLRYSLGGNSFLRLRSAIQLKNVEVQNYAREVLDRRRKRIDQRISNDLAYVIKGKRFYSQLALSYWSQEQKYDLEVQQASVPFSRRTAFVTPNNTSNRFALRSWTGVRLNQSDSLMTFFSASRFQYDTPDSNNFDDRDELRINSRVTFSHFFNPQLKLVLIASVNLYHIVYIYGERSADNNWNRILRLRPVITYRPSSRLRIKQAFEVLANYTDYDFENMNVTTKSFVFRKFAADDSLRWRISDEISLLQNYRLQLEENGQLSWEQWSERILATRQSHWFNFYLRYSLKEKIALSPGYTLYLREEWRHKTGPGGVQIKERIEPYLSHGPVLRFSYTPNYKMRLELTAIRYSVEPPHQKRYFNNDISLNLFWIF